jgi:hypothetical protein
MSKKSKIDKRLEPQQHYDPGQIEELLSLPLIATFDPTLPESVKQGIQAIQDTLERPERWIHVIRKPINEIDDPEYLTIQTDKQRLYDSIAQRWFELVEGNHNV